MKLSYTSGEMSVCFMVKSEDVHVLLDNGFDTIQLMDSGTGSIVTLEVADLHMESLVKLDDEEDTDLI